MTTTLIILASIVVFFFILRRNKKPTLKDVDIHALNSDEENLNEPIISYSIYTVDSILNHRYLNYSHKDFPNHVGILKGQYVEIDWNIINADLISISGVGLVKAVGRKAFYPTENTTYTITAKNKESAIQQAIYVRIFPQTISDKLVVKQPTIFIQSQQITKTPKLREMPVFAIEKPTISIEKPSVSALNGVLQNKIVTTSFTQKMKDYLSANSPKNKNNQDGRI